VKDLLRMQWVREGIAVTNSAKYKGNYLSRIASSVASSALVSSVWKMESEKRWG